METAEYLKRIKAIGVPDWIGYLNSNRYDKNQASFYTRLEDFVVKCKPISLRLKHDDLIDEFWNKNKAWGLPMDEIMRLLYK